MKILAQFIKYLEENKLLKFKILGNTEAHFKNRFKIQKYVFLAKYYGLNLPFKHDMYLYGPYSRSLIEKSYELANNSEKLYKPVKPLPKTSFDDEGFIHLVKDKNNDWLEIATTLIDRNRTIAQRDSLLENIENTKNGFTRKFIANVLNDLKNINLVKFT